MVSSNSTTVRDVIQAVFPNGYLDHDAYSTRLAALKARKKVPVTLHTALVNPPCSAVDLFALAGQLLLKSGAYHHVGPQVPGSDSATMLAVNRTRRNTWMRIGREWRGDGSRTLPPPPAELLKLWEELIAHADERVFRSPGFTVPAKAWWKAAIALFCIADEAARDIGFQTGGRKSAQADYIEAPIRARQANPRTTADKRGPSTLSRANPDQLCVLPKSRTPKVGCTIRSLSHNLAILPGRGLARAHWSFTPTSALPPGDGDPVPFNLVVLPLPFGIQATAFKGLPSKDGTWGWFDVQPHWCPASERGTTPPGLPAFLEFVDQVIARAVEDVGTVHALVLPEVALSYDVFRALCEHLKGADGFELLISGLFDGPKPVGKGLRHGNFTGMARFARSGTVAAFDMSIREKHHRWRLDRAQIETYALGSALDVNRGWWEHIDLLGRSLDIFVLRGGATVTTLICEDLARNDPCQELVRGIGPNFVVALLMDGPQRKDRWPARYATVLAEDPGSSVLSVTSFGLIRRTNQVGIHPPADQIGLFRDDTGTTTEIKLPTGAQAVCLTLQPTKITEHTLDGRGDKADAQSWRLTGVQPVRIANPNVKLMEGLWTEPLP